MAFLETCLLGSANYLKTTAAFKDEPQVDNRLIQNQDEHQDENFCDIGCCVGPVECKNAFHMIFDISINFSITLKVPERELFDNNSFWKGPNDDL